MQVYIVSGGFWVASRRSSTEILEKDGGTEWQEVASMPYALWGPKGVGLDNGRFMVTGECWTILYHHYFNSSCSAGGNGYLKEDEDRVYDSDEVLLYNSEEDEWTVVGHLSTARSTHGMSLVPANTADHCTDEDVE